MKLATSPVRIALAVRRELKTLASSRGETMSQTILALLAAVRRVEAKHKKETK